MSSHSAPVLIDRNELINDVLESADRTFGENEKLNVKVCRADTRADFLSFIH